MNLANSFKKDARYQIALALTVAFVINLIISKVWLSLLMLALTLGVALLIDYLFTKWITGYQYFPISAVVSALLISLNLDPEYGFVVFAVTAVIAMAGKHFLRIFKITDLHIFNPAALSLVFSQVLFGISGIWWGVANTNIATLVVLAVGAGYVLKRLKRLWLSLGFLVIYSVIILRAIYPLPAGWDGIEAIGPFLSLIFDGTVFLFVFVMLPEPQTSPATGIWKYAFGILVALVLFFVLQFSSILQVGNANLDAFLVSLLIADLLAFCIRVFSKNIKLFQLQPKH